MRLWLSLFVVVTCWSQTMLKQNYFSKEYIWTRTNGKDISGSLESPGAGKVLTFKQCPDLLVVGNRIRISAIGAASENATITAVACPVGSSGTVTITTTQGHSGGWSAGTATDGRQEAGAHVANGTWGDYVWKEQKPLPPFDYEAFSILANNHDYRANTGTPRETIFSTGSVALLGWTTPTNAEYAAFCPGCVPSDGYHEQQVLTMSMRHMNTYSPAAVWTSKINPGVDNVIGIWGFNINLSNGGKSNASSSSGIFGGEINIGLDNAATDEPTPGVSGRQVIGLGITESSANSTGPRVTTAIGISSSGTQNFHHGIFIGANAFAQTSMDTGITIKGPVAKPIDLTGTTNHAFDGSILLPNSSFGGIAIQDQLGFNRPVLRVDTGTNILKMLSPGGGINFNTRTGTQLLLLDEDGEVRIPPANLATHADNAAAIAGGLTVGTLYRTSSGQIMIRF